MTTITDGTVVWKIRNINDTRQQVETNTASIAKNAENITTHTTALSALLKGKNLSLTLLAGGESLAASTGIGSGTITLSESWRNFDMLLIIGADDNGAQVQPKLYFGWEFALVFDNIAKQKLKMTIWSIDENYWMIKPDESTDTTWVSPNQNSCILAIYGINFDL